VPDKAAFLLQRTKHPSKGGTRQPEFQGEVTLRGQSIAWFQTFRFNEVFQHYAHMTSNKYFPKTNLIYIDTNGKTNLILAAEPKLIGCE
jgi:hypothetical protein